MNEVAKKNTNDDQLDQTMSMTQIRISQDYCDTEEQGCTEKESAMLKVVNILREFGLENIKGFNFKDKNNLVHNIEIIDKSLTRAFPIMNDYLILKVKDVQSGLIYNIGLGEEEVDFNLDIDIKHKITKDDITEREKNIDTIKSQITMFRELLLSIEKGWIIVSKSGTEREVTEILAKSNTGEPIPILNVGKQQQILLEDRTRDPNAKFNPDYLQTSEWTEIMENTYIRFKRIAFDDSDRIETKTMGTIDKSASAIAYVKSLDGTTYSLA